MPDGSKCPVCKGTGFSGKTGHSNPAQTVTLPLPSDPTPEQIIDLSKMIHFVNPPVDLLKFMETHLDKLEERCRLAVYGGQLFSKQEIAQTATKNNIDLQNVYDALYPLAVSWSKDWAWFIETIASVVDMQEGLIAAYRFGKDFKMKSLDDLYIDLEKVSTSGADDFIKSAIQDDIAGIIYAEDPQQLQKYETMKAFFPFPGKTKEEIIVITAGQMTSQFNTILWANYDYIFSRLEMEQGLQSKNFYQLDRNIQWDLIKAAVNLMISELPKAPEPVLFK